MKLTKAHFVKLFFECVIIIVSVLFAFFIENYREDKEQFANELQLLSEITSDLKEDSILFAEKVSTLTQLHKGMNRIILFLEGKTNSLDSLEDYPLMWVERARGNSIVFESIKNTGGFKFITDKQITKGLLEYYNERMFLSEIVEQELVANQERIKDLLVKNGKFQDFNRTTFILDKSSFLKLKGNQELINLCYAKKFTIFGTIRGIENRKQKLDELIKRCDRYLINKI